MPPRTKAGSSERGTAIRERRMVLGLSIEEAASKANLGTKTWGRYEAGAAIREDKVRGLCKALGWSQLPDANEENTDHWLRNIGKEHEAWSDTLLELYGRTCAVTFAVGSDLLYDHIAQDLEALANEPRGTHLGQLDMSWLDGSLPPQFVPRYDYDFVYALNAAVYTLRERFVVGQLVAETVIEELALYLILSNADLLSDMDYELFEEDDDWLEWLGDILGDLDIQYFLFSSRRVLTKQIAYHFDHWHEPQFYVDDQAMTSFEKAAASLGVLHSDSNIEDTEPPSA